eukprot:GFUD01083686.1.p1 GENE.GFUD01083686.1~~GFUD01083686.1.p1  ORF type:complete len:338 (-),score=94.39 GFUD01083686.1:57-1070(-)
MKIFVHDLQGLCGAGGGRTILLEVEVGDTVTMVKKKLQELGGVRVEIMKLSYRLKRLQDKDILADINIDPFSRLELRHQHAPPPGDDVMTNKEDEWDAIALAAKETFDKEVGEKKRKYSELKEDKTKSLESITIIEFKIKFDAKCLEDDLKELNSTEKDIDAAQCDLNNKKQEVRELEKLISKDLKKKMELKTSINQKRSTREIRRKQIMCLNTHIEKLETDTKQLFNDVGGQNKKLLEENIKIKDKQSALRTFLSESVDQKESLLECPVCYNTACPPISKCPSDHLICYNCLPRVNGKCPTCRTRYAWVNGSVTRSRLAEENYEELQKIKAMLDVM